MCDSVLRVAYVEYTLGTRRSVRKRVRRHTRLAALAACCALFVKLSDA